MRIFKNDCSCEIPREIQASTFAHTLACLAKANWSKTLDGYGHCEYYGYSNGNMQKAFKAKHFPYIYSHYRLAFGNDGLTAILENNNSACWELKFDTKAECKQFKRDIIMPKLFSFKKKTR